MYLLKGFLDCGFLPELVRKGRQIYVLEIKPLGIRILSSSSYIKGNEYEIANQFGIVFEQHFFPHRFVAKENFSYNGKIPNEYFVSAFDSNEEMICKDNFLSTYNSLNKNWNFIQEIMIHYDQKINLLVLSFLKLLEECFEFQLLAKCNQIVNPISFPLCSISGFSYKLFKIMFLNTEDIYIVKNEFSVPMRTVSKIEFEFTSYFHYKFPEKEFISEFSNPKGQMYFKSCVPDLYSPVTKECYFMNGCYFHGHINCLINTTATENTIRNGKTYKQLNDEFDKKIANLFVESPEKVKKVTIMWECQFLEKKKEKEIASFFKRIFVPHPLVRLVPRMALRNSYFDVFNLKYDKSMYPNHTMKFIDVNSHYAYIASEYKFMVGKYVVLIGNTISDLKIINNTFYFNNKTVLGSLLISILPPQNLMFPFLPYRTKCGQTVNTLCRMCAENLSLHCNHEEKDRILTGCYMISEVAFALTLNYKIIKIYEAHVYENSKKILKNYMKMVNFYKMKHSDCLKNCKTNTEKDNYCELLNNEMKFKKPFNLETNIIEPNKSKRFFYKLMANSTIGKLGQRNDKNKTIYVSDNSQIENIYFSPNKIEDIFLVNKNFCQVEIKQDISKIPPNRSSSCYLEAQLTSYARELIYKHMLTVVNTGAILFNVDCDSIIFALDKNQSCPLIVNDSIGNFKDELGNVDILNFYSLGPKNYTLSYQKNDKIESISKVRGLCLSSSSNHTLLNDKLFDKFIQQYFANEKVQCKIPQHRFKGNLKKLKINSGIDLIRYSNDISTRRYIKKEDYNLNSPHCYVTYPYGFKK
jgi:hypothetical protein